MRLRGRPWSWAWFAGFVAGLAVAGVFWRRQVRALAVRAVPYIRQSASVRAPTLIINRWSGDGKAERYGLATAATDAGVRVVMLERGDDLTQLAHDAIDAGADAIGMAGGDGSLGLVAAVAIERGVPFFCIPVGTRNHFALDLGLDRDNPLSALDALRQGEEVLIDYAVVGERPFLNNVSFGVYAQAVHQDRYRDNKEETLLDVTRSAAADPEAQAALRYETPDGRTHDRAPLLLVSNNLYRYSGPPDFGRRLRLDGGTLGIGAITNLPDGSDGSALTLDQLRTMQEWEATSFRIESDEPILAGVDGEALTFESPLDLVIRPKGLRVLVPAGTKPGYVPVGEAVAASILDLANLGGEPDSMSHEPAAAAEAFADGRSAQNDRADRILRQLGALDRAVYGAVADTPTPDLDEPLRRLSDLASWSKLWIGIAGGIALVGGPHAGRRAVTTGLVSVGVTSAVVNQGIKRLYPRERPDREGEGVPEARQVKMPDSTSFPSGHSASGFAFADRGRNPAPGDRGGTPVSRGDRRLLAGAHRRPLPGRRCGRLTRRWGHRQRRCDHRAAARLQLTRDAGRALRSARHRRGGSGRCSRSPPTRGRHVLAAPVALLLPKNRT